MRVVTGAVLILMVSAPVAAQPVAAMATRVVTGDETAAPPQDSLAAPGAASRFLRDVGSDYKHFFSTETALWLGAGGGAALAVHQADQSIADWVADNSPSLPGGSIHGSQYYQIPAAITWWIIGSAMGSESQASAGRDFLRAQLSVVSWTYAVKYAANRTRPNGDPRGFPSGHASTSFATAAVLQDHFGWKVGIPAFVAAAYTGTTRIADNQHWASDVVFGAALGIACGRTVTIHMRNASAKVTTVPIPGGIGVSIGAAR